jgi:ABC-type sugar transport system permease subunit
MYKEMFVNLNNAHASAVAVVLLVAVIPVLIFNLRRLQQEQAR